MRRMLTLVMAAAMVQAPIVPMSASAATPKPKLAVVRYDGAVGREAPSLKAKKVTTFRVGTNLKRVVSATGHPNWWRVVRKGRQDVFIVRKAATTNPAKDLWPKRRYAKAYAKRIFPGKQYDCIREIIKRESSWAGRHSRNRGSGAYGIPQALPAIKLASAGPNWRDDPATQLRWMKRYVNGRYESACRAWNFKRSHGWYRTRDGKMMYAITILAG